MLRVFEHNEKKKTLCGEKPRVASGFLVEGPGVSTAGQRADQGWQQPWVIAAEDPVRIENVSLWSGTTVYKRLSVPDLAAPPSRVCAQRLTLWEGGPRKHLHVTEESRQVLLFTGDQ